MKLNVVIAGLVFSILSAPGVPAGESVISLGRLDSAHKRWALFGKSSSSLIGMTSKDAIAKFGMTANKTDSFGDGTYRWLIEECQTGTGNQDHCTTELWLDISNGNASSACLKRIPDCSRHLFKAKPLFQDESTLQGESQLLGNLKSEKDRWELFNGNCSKILGMTESKALSLFGATQREDCKNYRRYSWTIESSDSKPIKKRGNSTDTIELWLDFENSRALCGGLRAKAGRWFLVPHYER